MSKIKLSKKLLDLIPEFKPGMVYKFQLLGVKRDPKINRLIVPQNVFIPNIDSIYDFGANTGKGQNIQIQCVDRETPTGPDSHKETQIYLKQLSFSKSMQGLWTLRGDNPADREIFNHLYLSSFNSSNRGKEFHIPPRGRYLFEFVDEEAKIEKRIAYKSEIILAQSEVAKLSFEDMRILAKRLHKNKNVSFRFSDQYTESVLKGKLFKIAEQFPLVVKANTSEEDIDARRVIEKSIEKAIIKFNPAKKEISWAETGDIVLTIGRDRDYTEHLAKFLATEDGHVLLSSLKVELDKLQD